MDTHTPSPGNQASAAPGACTDPLGNEYLVLNLADQEYGIDILKVREIRSYNSQAVTRLANVPEFIRGVTNLRGFIVPILDMRMMLNLQSAPCNEQTAVVILNLDSHIVGIVVDGVSDVMTLRPEQISAAPQFHDVFASEFLTGIGTVGERMLILVDIARLLGNTEMALLEQHAPAA